MTTERTTPKDIDAYIASFPEPIQTLLQQIRLTIREAAPDAQETIKYQMPTFVLHGNLVYFAAFKKHIGFYPPVSGDKELQRAVAVYAGPKGNLQFPLDQPMPYDLIRKIVQARVKENLAKAAAKGKKTYG
ncbi:MAG: DUF1801 domain-containing protein [Caldilineaceae bacterium]